MADWNAIRTEYIQGGTSYRKLAAKYGVPFRTLSTRAGDEKWVQLREQASNKAVTKAVDTIARANARVDEAVYDAARDLLKAFRACVAAETDMTSARLKDYGAALKSIQSVLSSGPTELDIREQEARIANLRRQAEKADGDGALTVTLDGGMDEYAV